MYRIFCGDQPISPAPTIKPVKKVPYHLEICKKYMQLYSSASKRGKEFNLELRDVHELLQTRVCHYTGVKFDSANNDLSRTIDRIDNNKGYVKGNVVACTFAANQAKEALFERNGDIRTSIDFYRNIVNALEKTVDI